MGGACSKYGSVEVHTGILVGNLKGRDCVEDPASDGILILSWIFRKWNGGIDWIDLAESRGSWLPRVSAVMNLWVPQFTGNFLASW